MPTDFAIVTPGRSGSTLLQSAIDQHPDATCYGELLHPDRGTVALHWRRQSTRTLPRMATPQDAIRAIRDDHPNTHAVGFKLLYPHKPLELIKKSLRVIHLVRNPVECVASLHYALETGNWHKTKDGFTPLGHDGGPKKDRRILVSPAKFANYIQQWERARHQVEDLLGVDYIRVDYSDLVGDFLSTIASIYRWLGISTNYQPVVSTEKSSPPASETLYNVSAVRNLYENISLKLDGAPPNWTGLYQ